MRDTKMSSKYDLLDELFNLFLDDKYRQEDDELFEEWDIDIDGIVQKNMNLFRRLKTTTQAELNEMRHRRIHGFLAKLQEGIKAKTDKYLSIAEDITSRPQFVEIKVMFRHLEDISESDKESILKDAKLLEILSSFEEEFNEELNNEQASSDS